MLVIVSMQPIFAAPVAAQSSGKMILGVSSLTKVLTAQSPSDQEELYDAEETLIIVTNIFRELFNWLAGALLDPRVRISNHSELDLDSVDGVSKMFCFACCFHSGRSGFLGECYRCLLEAVKAVWTSKADWTSLSAAAF